MFVKKDLERQAVGQPPREGIASDALDVAAGRVVNCGRHGAGMAFSGRWAGLTPSQAKVNYWARFD